MKVKISVLKEVEIIKQKELLNFGNSSGKRPNNFFGRFQKLISFVFFLMGCSFLSYAALFLFSVFVSMK